MTDKITYGARPPKTQDEKKEKNQLLAVRTALLESEEKYRKLLDLSPDSIVILQDGKYQFVNTAFTRMFGYSQEDIDKGLSFYELVQPEDLDVIRRRYADRLAGKPVSKTFRIDLVARDGALIPCETSANLINFNGQSAHLVFIRDISERRMAEKAAHTSEETLRVLLDSTNELALLVARDGTVLTVNKNAAERYGKSPEAIKGMNIYPLMSTDVIELRKRKAEEVIKTKKPVRYTEENAGRYFDCNLFPILDEAGNVKFFTVFVKDVTERQQDHKELQNVRQELEHRVKQRTLELEKEAEKLEEVNTALKVLLKRLDEDKKATEEKVLFNVRQLVEPNLEKLKKGRLTERQKNLLEIIESNLNEIVSPFARGLSNSFMKLTPTEIQVANHIRQGKTTKEIADMLNLSAKTIEFHRDNIRTKIGIKNKKINLRTHLLSIQ